MKKLLMLGTLSFFVTCCATVGPTTVKTKTVLKQDLHERLTLANVEKNCNTDEFWKVRILSVPGMVVKNKQCLGYKNLLIVSVPLEDTTEKVRNLSRKLLVEQYLSYLYRRDREENPNAKWEAREIKVLVEEDWETSYLLLSKTQAKRVVE
jgi:hypothetical protein